MSSTVQKNKTWPVIFGIVGVIVIILPFFTGPYVQSIGRTVITYMILAISWDMLIRSGQLSFGLAGFFGLGSYAAVLSAVNLHFNPFVSILFAAVVAGLMAFLVGAVVLRLRGMYFAITTLALGEIFRIIIHNWTSVTGGPNGKLLPKLAFDGASIPTYAMMVVFALVIIALSEYFKRSKIHYALTAIRDNEIVAKSSGINIYKYLLIAFTVTAAIQGAAGAGFAQLYGFVTPESSFNANYTLIPLAMALLGGMYSTWGPVIGAVLLGVLGEFLKLYIPYGHLVVYGIIIILVLLFMPQGIVGMAGKLLKKGESHE
ncbi:branched-chain amino acid ABC transporter permease [Spirochaeta isovalerica]|uniref:Branched-chain amino acid transport system permease protein n=1 Tax=Spirochaeta isovalerica TaxID=150 RepID=A0A841RHN9_9SPIO|nr:branched-chain amino acid ABC transporter permease [Spirochaeta isovalerica]MBB6482530.1 branched-chain amino acid transport system permease protein [Spirochaeta isovalerica]